MCLYPKILKNRKYIANKKNKGNVPTAKDKRALYVPVGCGKCMECKKQKARQWQVRLQEDIRHNTNGKFVTLTFKPKKLRKLADEIDGLDGYDLDNEIATLAVKRFRERWRKKYKKSIRHWLVTELGHVNTERVHLHGIVWTDHISDISKIWKYGHVCIGKQKWNKGKLIYDGEHYVNERTINYMVKYVNKIDPVHKYYNSKVLTSPGIGKNYMNRIDHNNNKYKKGNTNETYKTRQGRKLNLPIYYRNQIYTEEEKEKLWMEKLDKQERWVNGVKICIKDGEEGYYSVLENARKKNKRLGYGDDSINWDKRKYENERRNLLKLKEG